MMSFRFSSLVVLGAGLAMAQKASFDVASIKTAAPQDAGKMMMSMGGDPGMIDYKHVSLRMLVQRAFGVKDYQVTAPDWASTAFFDVQAKLPPDTPQEKRNEMLQTLLEERFGLKFHKDTKEVPVYSLVQGKNGAKLKEVEAPPQARRDGPPAGDHRTAVVDPARVGAPGMMMMRMEGAGKMHLDARAMKIDNLADFLSRQVDRPILNDTGLTGYYDIQMDFKPEGRSMIPGAPAMLHSEGGPGAGGGPAPEGVEAPSIFTAVQDQLGLKLESKKGPIETIVVDHLEKSPIEN